MSPREYLVAGHGVELSVRDHRGGDPAVVALHGLASNARWWDLVAAKLRPQHRLIAPDMRGHGLSSRPDLGYDFPDCAADVVALMQQLLPGAAVLAGHSWGASVALSLAAERPDLVQGLVLVDGGVADMHRVFGDNWTEAELAMAPPDLEGLTRNHIGRWVEVSPLADATDVHTAGEMLLGNFDDDGRGGLVPRLSRARHMQIARHLFEFDNLAALARVHCPVLLIMATSGHDPDGHDRLMALKRSGVSDTLARLGDRGAIVWIEGEHDLPVQRPAEVATAIRAFIDSLDMRPPG